MHTSKKTHTILDWHLCITQMEMKWKKWYAMTSHVHTGQGIVFGTHAFDLIAF